MNIVVEAASLGQLDKTMVALKHTLVENLGGMSYIRKNIGIPIEVGAEIPFKYFWMAQYRPIIPPMGDCVEARSRYMIDDWTFRSTAKYHGINDTYLNWYLEFANTPLRYFALAAIARSGLYDEDFFENELKRAGYARDSIDKLKDMYQALAGEMEIAGAKSIASKAYREGIIDRSELEDYLLRSGLDPTLTTLSLDLADLQKETASRDLSTGVQAKLFKLGIINVSEFRTRLAGLGYTAAGIDDLVSINTIQKEADPKQLTISQLNDGIKYDLINEQFYYDKTKDLGYSREYSTLLLDILKAKQTKTPKELHRDLTYSQIMRMFKQELLTLEEVRERLEFMGYNPEDTDLLLASELREMTSPDSDVWKPLSRSIVIDLYMEGVIDYEEYLIRMEALRIKENDANLLIVLEYTKEAT